MKIFFASLFALITTFVVAQDRWKVCLDNKILLNTSTEDAEKNTITLSSKNLIKAKTFTITYSEATPQKGWERSIALYDANDAEFKKQVTKKFTLKASELKSLLEKSKTIKIYTTNMPTDPKMKAQVRIRRILLCTISFE